MGRPKNSKNKPKFGYLTLEELTHKLQNSNIAIPIKLDFLQALQIPHNILESSVKHPLLNDKHDIIEFSITEPKSIDSQPKNP